VTVIQERFVGKLPSGERRTERVGIRFDSFGTLPETLGDVLRTAFRCAHGETPEECGVLLERAQTDPEGSLDRLGLLDDQRA